MEENKQLIKELEDLFPQIKVRFKIKNTKEGTKLISDTFIFAWYDIIQINRILFLHNFIIGQIGIDKNSLYFLIMGW